MEKEKKIKVSPINNQPLPRGRQFTSETAREARRKRTEKERRQKSITAAFLQKMGEEFTDAKTGRKMTGAEIIAESIIKGATNGNPKMIDIALALTGETPSVKITMANGQLADLIDGLKEPCNYDLHTETTGVDGIVADE